ncbi:MAG: thiamine-phosphate kinase [candidate division KSB1 bacterium]|nr:thiamine-phosphate kinase [candidate division KSB1 bacterium]
MRISEIGEFGLIARLKAICGEPRADVVVGIDDDAAAFRAPEGELEVVTTDALVEGVHFLWDYFSPYQLGWRSMAANLSDMAAMAAEPQFAVVSVALPPSMSVEAVEDMYRGMVDLAGRYGVGIVGGDTTTSPRGMFLSITVIGKAPANRLVRRAGARVGDALFVTGYLGQSHAGLMVLSTPTRFAKQEFPSVVQRHLQPMPRVEEAIFLREHVNLSSMIDVSDGLASEVRHLSRLGGVGAVIVEEAIPVSPEARRVAAAMGHDARDYALGGGEDFELLFTARKEEVERILPRFEERFGLALTAVGEILPAHQGVKLYLADGHLQALPVAGWNHFAGKRHCRRGRGSGS